MEECWYFENECLMETPSVGYGFIYLIIDDKGKKYWGKKAFTHRQKRLLSKKAKLLPENKGKRVTVLQKDSGWLNYWGSCKPLLAYIKERGSTQGFQRYILKVCDDKQSLAYWEMAILVKEEVLFRTDTWNGNVLAKFFKGKIK